MSNINGFGLSVKDYAEQRGKTVQAVYQQMKRKENAVALAGHVTTHKIGNKHVKFLDDEAVAILDAGTNSTPSIIIQTETEEKLAEVTQKLEGLKFEYGKLQGRNELLQEQLADKDAKLLLLEGSAREIEMLHKDVDTAKAEIEAQKAQNALLSAERDAAIEKTLEAEKKAQEALEKLREKEEENEAMRKASWFQRLKGWKK